MTLPRLAFIDWMKATGMFLIVAGHVVGGPINFISPPIYFKQFGVAFFLFVAAFTLARETRPVWQVVVSRLFEILLIGAACALISTAFSLAAGGRGQFSNYQPLLLGMNVVYNNFPANPTTWYIGTYIHVILLWALAVRFVRVTPALLAGSAVAEVIIRVVVWQSAGAFVAYMLVTNWMTVWLLGAYCGQRHVERRSNTWALVAAALAFATPLVAGSVWSFDDTLPFRQPAMGGAAGPLMVSAFVSMLYLGGTWLAFRATLRLEAHRAVQFAAAQTIIIFVAHMPVYYWVREWMAGWPRPPRAIVLVLVCFFGLALLGGLVHRVFPLATLKDRLIALIGRRTRLAVTA
jgi:hypothetical protein